MSTTITFKSSFPSGCPSAAAPYKEAGLVFTNNVGNRWASPFINGFIGTYGSPSHLIVSPDGGGTFDFTSMQVCNANSAIPPQTITFIGTKASGAVVSQSFTTPDRNAAPQTMAPAGFTGLVSMTVNLGFVAFENFVFTGQTVRTVTFQAGFPPGCPSAPTIYKEAGLSFTNNIGNRWASPAVNNFVGCYGVPCQITATADPGKVFDFKSLQVCNINSAIDTSQSVIFTGTRADNTTVTASFATSPHNIAPLTCAPPGFTNLTKLTVNLGFAVFDNLVFAANW